MTITEPTIRHTKSARAFFKAVTGPDVAEGTFDAIVAVFNNVDLGGDRLIPGAFADSLVEWRASGDPIPVIFSHQWEDLYAHVGEVDPNNVKELLPGDALLPPELKDLGGLGIFGAQMDLTAPGEAGAFASNLWAKLSRRTIKEFSFAYEIPPGGARAAKDATDLIKVGLIEVGPTLKGMNPATALLNAKAARKAIDGLTPEAALTLLDDLVPVPGPRKARTPAPANTKRLPTGTRPDGAVETVLDAVSSSARLWGLAKYGNELYAVHLEGTFLDTGKAVITAERWSDPYGEGPVFELSFELSEDGTATITGDAEVEVTVTLAHASAEGTKRRAKAFLDRGFDRKTAVWLTILDDASFEDLYGDADGPEPDDVGTGGASTTLAASSANLDGTPSQDRGAPNRAKAEERSAASSPTGVLLALEELETNP